MDGGTDTGILGYVQNLKGWYPDLHTTFHDKSLLLKKVISSLHVTNFSNMDYLWTTVFKC